MGINGLEGKIWRVIEVTDKMTIGDLAYSILASFNSLAYHLYSITYKDREYNCYIDDDLLFDDETALDAIQSILSNIWLNDNDIMEMEYDFESMSTFKIKYLGYIKLEDIVKDTDKLGYSKYSYSPEYGANKKMIWKYRII